MKKYAYIFFPVLSLISCASHKNNDRHTVTSYSSENLENTNKTSTSNLSEIDWGLLLELEDLEINIKRYDTTAQPDSLGNYPLKEEETRKSKRKTQKEEYKQKEEQKAEQEQYQLQSSAQNNFEEKQKIETSTEVASPFNLNWLWLLIIPAVGIYVFKKFTLKK